MSNIERKEGRYQRRKAKRLQNKTNRCLQIHDFNDPIAFFLLFKYGLDCCKGVRWKHSVQLFESRLLLYTYQALHSLETGKWKPNKFVQFKIAERGKVRHIDAPRIYDRQIEKYLCNEVLIPLYKPTMILDNGASQKDRGLHWSFKRLKKHLTYHFKRYGRKGGIFLMDLKKFFPSGSHKLVYERHEDLLSANPNLKWVADMVIKYAPTAHTGKGLPIGVEPSQQEMVALPSKVDNYVKCQLGIKGFAHYMDDYYLLCDDMDKLQKIAKVVVDKCEQMKIPINHDKCHIIPLTHSFKFCKATFRLTESGRILIHCNSDSMKRARRKLKMFARRLETGERTVERLQQSFISSLAYFNKYHDYKRRMKLVHLYYNLFIKTGLLKRALQREEEQRKARFK